MPELKVAVAARSLPLPMDRALAAIARMGARGVELDAAGPLRPDQFSQTAARHLRKLLDDHRLQPTAVACYTRRGFNVQEGLDARIDHTRSVMRIAGRVGAPLVVNHVGRVAAEDDPAFALQVEVLRELGLYGLRVGAVLAAETGSESGADLRRLLDALPEGAVLVNFDPANLVVQGHSISEALEALGPYIAQVHARDAVRDLAAGRSLEVPLGRGSVDWPNLIGTLEEYDFRGFFTLVRPADEGSQTALDNAVAWLRNLD